MPLINSYAVWNNKGGVGKSTITFHFATRYAQQNPNTKILVIDMCPQSNSSMMLLGGGQKGETTVMTLCTAATPRTVVGYLSQVIAGGEFASPPAPMNFLVQPNQYNPSVPDNLFLLCGDGNLEPMSPAVSRAADAPALTTTSNPWLWVHSVYKNLINQLSNSPENWIVFIDTNPSFSVYTQIAVASSARLIVPVNADDSSRVATNAMFVLLHGQTPPHPVYGSWTFAQRAITAKLQIPEVHLIVGNRLTSYLGAATAFSALSDATADTLFSAYKSHPHYFTSRPKPASKIKSFRDQYSRPLRDFNTAGVVAAHLGRTISSLKQGYYPVHGTEVKVNADQIQSAKDAIDDVLSFV